MPSLPSWFRHLLWLVLGLCCSVSVAHSAEIEVRNPQLAMSEEGYVLSADFAMELNSRLEDAVTRGVVLSFVTEFELTRPRWYWFDEKAWSKTQTYQLYYHALTRQYRLSSGALHQSFPNLAEAMAVLSRLRNWVVVDKGGQIKAGDTYQAALRLRLDISQLPKPFQISALANKEWTLASDWSRWQFVVPAESGK